MASVPPAQALSKTEPNAQAVKVSFIRPNLSDRRSHDAMEPLAFAVLAGVTPRHIQLELWDERVESIPLRLDSDLVAITVETYTARRAYQLADRFRAQGIKVVAGGYHATFLPEETLQHVDSVVCGDAELLWPQLLEDFQRGDLKPHYRQTGAMPMDGLVYDRSIFRGKRYGMVTPVQFSRGCRYACDFCSIHAFYGRTLVHRPVEEVVDEVRRLGRKLLFLVDDNLLVDIERTSKLLRAMVGLGVYWGCQISLDAACDDDFLKLLAASGCVAVLVGFESLDERNLVLMKKKWNLKYGTYQAAIARFHQHGIMVYGSFIFGYDHDTSEVFQKTLDFALEARLFLVNFSALTPTPATGLYDRLQEQGRLLYPSWWTDPRYSYGDAVYQPTHMTPEQLTQGCTWARQQFFSLSNIAKRTLFPAPGCGSLRQRFLSLLANLVSRRELQVKLGRPLGSNPAPT